MRVGLVVIVALSVLGIGFAACGGGSSETPEEQVKDRTAEFIEAELDGDKERACAMATNPLEACVAALGRVADLLGEGGWEELLGEDWREQLENGAVTFADENHATVTFSAEKENIANFYTYTAELVREDGEWMIIVEEE